MKVLLINSVKYGTKEVLLDDEDFAVVNKWSWGLCTSEKDHTFYAHRTERGTRKTIRMHRLIMGITDSKTLVDHKDRNGLNNQKDNLRICTYSQNGCNRKISSNKSSKFIGTTLHINGKKPYRWRAQIKYNNKVFHIGCFENEIDAALAYNKKALELHGEFANLNVIS